MSASDRSLTGAAAIVIGAASGIGRAVAGQRVDGAMRWQSLPSLFTS